jgi:serine/threonine protein phosphatase PrpC
VKIGYQSDVGKQRKLDEDSIIIVRTDAVYESEKIQRALLVLADGMGGHNAGEIASFLAAKRVAEEMTRVILKKQQISDEKIEILLRESIRQANREICDYAERNPQHKGMGATLTAAIILGINVHIGHIGDSRAYIFNKREIKQITKDHSLVQEMLDSGKITEEEARIHPQKNIITRSVGLREDVAVDTFKECIFEEDFLLICCDGLTDVVSDEEIHAVVMHNDDPQKMCDILVQKANDKGGPDNISVIIAKSCESPSKMDALKSTEIRSNIRE